MFKKIIIIAVLVIIGIIGLGFVYLNNVYIPQHLKPLVIELAQKNLGKNVSIDKALYFPFRGVLFSGINIENQDGSAFLTVDKVDLSLKSFPKVTPKQTGLKARLIVQGVKLNQQELAVSGSSVIDLDFALAENKTPVFKADIKLDNLQIKGIPNIAAVEKISGDIICDQDSFNSEKLNAYIGKQQLNLIFNGKYTQNDLNLDQFRIDFAKTNLEAKGKLDDFKKLNLEMSLSGLIDLADISKILTIKPLPVLSGQCTITADASGPVTDMNSLKAKAQAVLKQGAVDKIKFSDLKAEITFAQSALNLAPLTCTFYEGNISAALKAEIKNKLPIQGSLDIEKVNLQPLCKDIITQDMGTGQFNAHAGVSGSAADLNSLNGSGWFKIDQASLKPPDNFNKVAQALKLPQLADMRITQSSATFSLSDGKVQTEDFVAVSDYATINGKGYIDLEQYVDFEVRFSLSDSLASGQFGQVASIAADGAKVKLYDKVSQLKYKVEFSAQDMIKNESTKILKGLFEPADSNQSNNAQPEQTGNREIRNKIKTGIKKIFR